MAFSHQVSFIAGLWQFFGLCLFFMTLTVLKVTSQVLCRMALNLSLSDVFLMSCLGLWVFGKDHSRVELPFSSLLTGVYYVHVTYLVLTLITWVRRGVFVRFLHSKVANFSPFYTILWKPDAKSTPYSGVGRIKFNHLKGGVSTILPVLYFLKINFRLNSLNVIVKLHAFFSTLFWT